MKTANKYWIAGLLVVSSVSLSVLVPGGPIETRSFSHIHPMILGSFNTFLTALSLFSLVLVYFVWKQRHWAFAASAACGLSYFLTYGLDLARLFPVSPDPMPAALLSIEVWGILLSLPLMLLAGQSVLRGVPVSGATLPSKAMAAPTSRYALPGIAGQQFAYAFALVLLAVSIITFATHSAMGL